MPRHLYFSRKYRGTELRYISHTTRRNPNSPWSRQLIYQGDVTYTHNRADNGNEMAGMLNFSYGKHYNWQMLDGKLDMKAGALADLNLGFILQHPQQQPRSNEGLFQHNTLCGKPIISMSNGRNSSSATSWTCLWLASCSRQTMDNPIMKYFQEEIMTTTSCRRHSFRHHRCARCFHWMSPSVSQCFASDI